MRPLIMSLHVKFLGRERDQRPIRINCSSSSVGRKRQQIVGLEHIIYRLYAMNVFDGELKARLMGAAKSQNFLLHRLLRDRTMSLATPQGMRELQDELDGYIHIFNQLLDEIARIIKPMEVSFGMNPEESEAFAEQMAAKPSLPEFLKKQEQLARTPIHEPNCIVIAAAHGTFGINVPTALLSLADELID